MRFEPSCVALVLGLTVTTACSAIRPPRQAGEPQLAGSEVAASMLPAPPRVAPATSEPEPAAAEAETAPTANATEPPVDRVIELDEPMLEVAAMPATAPAVADSPVIELDDPASFIAVESPVIELDEPSLAPVKAKTTTIPK